MVQRHSAVYQRQVYQRSSPVVNDKGETVNLFVDPQATVHMVVGTGGDDDDDDDNVKTPFQYGS